MTHTRALEEFVETIESSGGITRLDGDLMAPVASPEWVDLGHAYVLACEALGRPPVIDWEYE